MDTRQVRGTYSTQSKLNYTTYLKTGEQFPTRYFVAEPKPVNSHELYLNTFSELINNLKLINFNYFGNGYYPFENGMGIENWYSHSKWKWEFTNNPPTTWTWSPTEYLNLHILLEDTIYWILTTLKEPEEMKHVQLYIKRLRQHIEPPYCHNTQLAYIISWLRSLKSRKILPKSLSKHSNTLNLVLKCLSMKMVEINANMDPNSEESKELIKELMDLGDKYMPSDTISDKLFIYFNDKMQEKMTKWHSRKLRYIDFEPIPKINDQWKGEILNREGISEYVSKCTKIVHLSKDKIKSIMKEYK